MRTHVPLSINQLLRGELVAELGLQHLGIRVPDAQGNQCADVAEHR